MLAATAYIIIICGLIILFRLKWDKGDERGFTLIELLVVVTIIGIISAIAVPNLINAVHRSKQKRTMADIRSLGTAIEEYAVDAGYFPVADSITALEGKVVPAYSRAIPTRDAWQNDFHIDSTALSYTVASCGKDAAGTCTPVCTDGCGASQLFTDDIIFGHGHFIQWPEGTQR
jgi:general secretion pathway protein G